MALNSNNRNGQNDADYKRSRGIMKGKPHGGNLAKSKALKNKTGYGMRTNPHASSLKEGYYFDTKRQEVKKRTK